MIAQKIMSRQVSVLGRKLLSQVPIAAGMSPTTAVVVAAPLAGSNQIFASSRSTPGSDAKEEKKEEATTEATTESTEEAAAPEAAGPSREEELEQQVKDLKDQLLRSLAEQENTRHIAKRDIAEAKNFAIKSFTKSLLEVSDNLQRALDSVDEESMKGDASAHPAIGQLLTLYQGVQMTNDGLTKAFLQNGVKRFCEKPGEKFDPSLHNALMSYPDPSKEPDTVGQVIKVGYTLNDRVLRPAEVGVIKK
eukprot:Nitzschia sp. Nitz4//scaffold152_size53828//25177//25932//NITZ4_006743-RA/size53828-processed-gene-0.36-mRNA-1//1//CDS//3329537205//8561//frame0